MRLTPENINRRRVILAALAQGMTPDEIAAGCRLSRATVYREIRAIERTRAEGRRTS